MNGLVEYPTRLIQLTKFIYEGNYLQYLWPRSYVAETVDGIQMCFVESIIRKYSVCIQRGHEDVK